MPTGSRKQYAGDSTHRASGIAGASSGTVLALVANTLPPSSPWRPWLILIAPSIAVVVSGFVVWANRLLEDYLIDKRKRLFFARIKNTIEAALNNPSTSSTHKDELRAQLEKIEKLQFQSDLKLLVKEWH